MSSRLLQLEKAIIAPPYFRKLSGLWKIITPPTNVPMTRKDVFAKLRVFEPRTTVITCLAAAELWVWSSISSETVRVLQVNCLSCFPEQEISPKSLRVNNVWSCFSTKRYNLIFTNWENHPSSFRFQTAVHIKKPTVQKRCLFNAFQRLREI